MPDIWKKAKILTSMYEAIGRALAGESACPRIASFQAGYGLIDESGVEPLLLEIPPETDAIPGVVYEGVPEMIFSDGRTLAKCIIPESAVTDPQKVTVIGLFDQGNNLVAVLTFLPEWITPDKRYENYVYIEFPLEGQ